MMPAEGSVSDALNAEHRRLELLWKKARGALEQKATAGPALKSFGDGLRQHIRDEEEVLFPVFEERTGMSATAGPTAVMRMEHRQFEALLIDLAGPFDGQAAPETILQAADALSRLLDDHDAKEEGMLYPMMDRAFRPDEKAALLARIETLHRTA
jgi:iron-sulfur cluster repair protein YtfE (RIC family)